MSIPDGTKELPAIFSPLSVEAIFAGRKTQTRRREKRPRWQVGDHLWVRERYWLVDVPDSDLPHLLYHDEIEAYGRGVEVPRRPWRFKELRSPRYRFGPRSSIHFPRWASRLGLLVTGARAQALGDVSQADAIAEGFGDAAMLTPLERFQAEWDRLHDGAWDDDEIVTAYTFTIERRS